VDKLTMQPENVDYLLKPKTLLGAGMEYTLGDKCLIITNLNQNDTAKRKLELSLTGLDRFISELQQIERLLHEGSGRTH
jgi:hypothetical protein